MRRSRSAPLLLALLAGELSLAAAPPPAAPPARTSAASTTPAAAKPKSREVGKYRMPDGPVTITADRAEFGQEGVMQYRGHVKLVSGQLELTGERLDLEQPAKGQYVARVTGRPAKLRHAGEGPAQPPIAASANQIDYDSRIGTVEMKQDVQLDRGGDVLSGETLLYDVAARRITAGGTGSQVRIVIQPRDKSQLPDPKKLRPKEG
ncbi:MAG TPA: lipopolysaccharide transport periplasmic protein LptA [Candidatus Binatia bacterium]|nr:lipopolysaccharide transport periplasmic protein LptA [Candidatus Binatia bacterium]